MQSVDCREKKTRTHFCNQYIACIHYSISIKSPMEKKVFIYLHELCKHRGVWCFGCIQLRVYWNVFIWVKCSAQYAIFDRTYGLKALLSFHAFQSCAYYVSARLLSAIDFCCMCCWFFLFFFHATVRLYIFESVIITTQFCFFFLVFFCAGEPQEECVRCGKMYILSGDLNKGACGKCLGIVPTRDQLKSTPFRSSGESSGTEEEEEDEEELSNDIPWLMKM